MKASLTWLRSLPIIGPELQRTSDEMIRYLGDNISYSLDEGMKRGMELYFELAKKNGLLAENRPLVYAEKY